MIRQTLLSPALIFTIIVGTYISASETHAALIVDWGGTGYVTANQSMQSGGFSSGDPLPLYPAAGYSTVQTSAIFYGQAVAATSPQFLVVNTTADQLQYKAADSSSFTALTLWTSPVFLGAAQNSAVKLGANSVSMNINTYTQLQSVRLAVRINDSSYYLSQQAFTAGTGLKTIDPTVLTWYQYDPATTLVFDQGSATVANIVSGGLISNVTEVGIYVDRLSGGGGGNALRLDSFEVDAVPVPEPSTIALLGLGIAGLATFRQRKRATFIS